MAEKQGMWDSFTKQANYRINQADKALDDPNLLGAYLGVAGAAGGAVGDVSAAAFEAITPQAAEDYLKDVMGEAYSRYSGTKLGKELVDLVKNNPKGAGYIGSAVNILGALPLLSSLKKYGMQAIKTPSLMKKDGLVEGGLKGLLPDFSADIAQHMPVHMRGGISIGDTADAIKAARVALGKEVQGPTRTMGEILKGDNKAIGTGVNFYGPRLEQALSIIGEGIDGVVPALRAAMSPAALAQLEAKGITMSSLQVLNKLRREGNPLAEAGELQMQNLMYRGNSPTVPPLFKPGQPLNLEVEIGKPRSLTLEEPSLRQDIFGGLQGKFRKIPDEIADRHMNHIKNGHQLDPMKDTTVTVKRPQSEGIGEEAAGAAFKTGSTLTRGFANGSLMNAWKGIQGKVTGQKFKGDIPSEGLIELMQISGGMTKENIRKYNKLYNKQNGTKVKLGGTDILVKLMKARAVKASGRTPNVDEDKVLKAWDNNDLSTIKDDLGNIISDRNSPNGNMRDYNGGAHTSTSHISMNKELGGLNTVFSLMMGKVKNKGRAYATVSDVSDLKGVGGKRDSKQVMTVSPTQVINTLQKDMYTPSGRVAHKADKARFSNPTSSQAIQQGTRELEELTGWVKPKDMSDKAFHKKILAEYNPEVKGRHMVKAIKNGLSIGLVVTQNDMYED